MQTLKETVVVSEMKLIEFPTLGSETVLVPQKSRIGFLTSGGDAPGMNAAIRAIVRMSLYKRCEPFAIYEGFRGMIQGGNMIVPFGWNDVASSVSEGGTIIKSSRCPEFLERKFRKIAVKNLVDNGIDKLIVIGGDGSLTGADQLKQEWNELLKELVNEGELCKESLEKFENLMIVGLAGSIDNDMVGTEMTIGANSSLHRIIEAIDCIHSTASSHQRAFVIEVMGRHCGWLALNAAISCGADWLFVPEDPPKGDWEKEMCKDLLHHRALGRTVTIVIIAEGAVDRQNRQIKSERVKEILTCCGLDARVTTLGHVQRGGNPSAYDRYLATMQGIKAVEVILGNDPKTTPSLLVGMNENRMTCRPLMECVAKTKMALKAMKELRFEDAFNLRDPDFKANYSIWNLMLKGTLPDIKKDHNPNYDLKLGVINCGAPCGGMNAAVAASVLYTMSKNLKVVGIFNGFEGLVQGDFRDLTINDIHGLIGKGGSMLGTNRSLPSQNIEKVIEQLKQMGISALIIIGGFEAYKASLQLDKAKTQYASSFNLSIVVIPATISNNVPGTEYSIGSDTALNVIAQSCDYIRQSATSSRKRVFVVDVHGGYCGYLATIAGLATGATRSYIHEEGLHLSDLQREAAHLRDRFTDDKKQGRLIIRNEFCSDLYSAEFISKILEEESDNAYDSRWVVLGHLQQGGLPSPLDRIRAVRLAVLSMRYIENLLATSPSHSSTTETLLANIYSPSSDHDCDDDEDEDDDDEKEKMKSEKEEKEKEEMSSINEQNSLKSSVVIGIRGPKVCFTSINKLIPQTDMKLRRPLNQWWLPLGHYLRILAKYKE